MQRSETALKHLKGILDSVEADLLDVEVFTEGDRTFHLGVAEATENPVLVAAMSIVHELMGQQLWLTLMRETSRVTLGRWQS
jgi:DNA-binding FadR family transcriptional regulator